MALNDIGKSKDLIATITPPEAYDKSVTWATSNPAVCFVSQNGNIIALSEGISVVTATTVDGGYIAICVVTVTKDASGIKKMNVEPLNGSEEIFNARGQRINKLQQGVNIIRMNDGTVKKIWIK